MLPAHLIANYWIDVFTNLVERYGLTPTDAKDAIDATRRELDAVGMGDMTYHRGSADRAAGIAAGWKNGYYRADASKVPA